MGDCGSKQHAMLDGVDDSVHVMIRHDKNMQKKRGEKEHGYVPRRSHPSMTADDGTDAAPSENADY